jgi:hypothetical protein
VVGLDGAKRKWPSVIAAFEALIDNLETALGRKTVKIGAEGKEVYVYRGDVANRAIQLAGIEVGLFTQKSEIRDDLDKLSNVELAQVLQREATALLEHYSRRDGEDRS